ncbi:hypothetical protein FRC03_007170 [Tulasnella sp. 419]|nr:hypothetical protein FRC03_007170 [Tulasnella sp. 419]
MPFFNRVARATVVEPLSPKPNLFKKLRSKIGKKVKRTFKKRSRLPALDDGVVYRLEGGRLRTRTVAPRAIDAVIEELDEVLDQCLEKPDDYSDDEIPKNKMPKVSAELPKELYVIQEEDESETDESQIAETDTEEVDQGPSDSASSKSLKIAQERYNFSSTRHQLTLAIV